MSDAGRFSRDREPLSPGPPVRLLAALRGPGSDRRRLQVPVWLRVMVTVAVTLVLGTWGFLGLHTPKPLDFLESLYAAVRLYALDLGPASGTIAGPNWQIWVALVLAAALVARGVLALGRERLRRSAVRHLLSGHVIVCGAGVHGTSLARKLSDRHEVVLIDVDPISPGMQEIPGAYEWRLIGDAVSERTLRAAGARRANWVIAVTGNDFVNSQIVSAMRSLARHGSARDRAHVLVQVEDPSLARFLEEEAEGPEPRSAARPVVSPFSANAIAAEVLLEESQVRLSDGDELGPLVAMRAGAAPNLLLVGDHPLIDALVLESLRRWRVRILREYEAGSGRVRPPMHVSVYGPAAEHRVARLRDRWRPEPSALTFEGRDSAPLGEGGAEFDDWLRRADRGEHAIVASVDELHGIALTLSVARALGDRARMTRVTTQFENALDAHLEDRTRHSSTLATTDVKSIADLGARPDQMRRRPGIQRLTDALAPDPGVVSDPEAGDLPSAAERALALFERPELGLHSDASWRIRGCERPLVQALLEFGPRARSGERQAGQSALVTTPADVPLSAIVRAGLRVELGTSANLLTAARRLTAADHPMAFTAWCEHLRHMPADGAAPGEPATGDRAVGHLLALWRAVRGDRDALRDLLPEGSPLTGAGRVTILAGAAGSMSAPARRELEPLLDRALTGYDGVILSGGTDVGVPGIAGWIAHRRQLRLVGYTPAGMGAHDLYRIIRETPDSGDFSRLEPLAMWTDIVRSGLEPGEVRLIVCPGGAITREEIVLARALGAHVGWLDAAGDAPDPLDDVLPFGVAGVLELPADPMTVRSFIVPSRLPETLRETAGRYLHNDYRRTQRQRKGYGDPALARWDELPASLKASNLAQADDIPAKLALIGKRLAQPGERLRLTDDQVELLAEAEHGRWNVERLSAGWRLGEREVGRSTSPDLRPWAELDDGVRDYDREAVRNIATALADSDWGVEDV
jgi:hypothetical protein